MSNNQLENSIHNSDLKHEIMRKENTNKEVSFLSKSQNSKDMKEEKDMPHFWMRLNIKDKLLTNQNL